MEEHHDRADPGDPVISLSQTEERNLYFSHTPVSGSTCFIKANIKLIQFHWLSEEVNTVALRFLVLKPNVEFYMI